MCFFSIRIAKCYKYGFRYTKRISCIGYHMNNLKHLSAFDDC